MSLKIIKPIPITDAIVESTIPEPDASQGEKEWEDRTTPIIKTTNPGYTNLANCVTDDGVVYVFGNNISYLDASGTQILINASQYNRFVTCTYFNGFIYAPLDDASKYYIVDVSDNSVEELVGGGLNDAYCSAYGGNGKVYFGGNGAIHELDISTKAITTKTVSDDGEDFEMYDVILGLDGNLYFVGFNTESGIYRMISYSVDSGSYAFIASLSAAGNAITQGLDGQLYTAGRGSVAMVNPETKAVSFFGVVGGVIHSLTTSDNGDIMAAGINPSGFSSLRVIDTSNQTVSSVAELELGFRLSSGVYYGGVTYFCSPSGLNGSILDRYSDGDQAILSSTHLIYQAADNTYESPDVGVLSTPPSWVEVSATNKYKAFDYKISTAAEFELSSLNSAQVLLTPGEAVTTISVFGMLRINSIVVSVFEDDENGTLIYSNTFDAEMSAPTDDLIVNDVFLNDKMYFDGLPTYENPYIRLIFRSDDLTCSVGDIVIGNARSLGLATYSSSTSRTSYDTVEYDSFGNVTTVSRPSAEYTSFEVVVYPEFANYVERILKDSLNQPRVWVGDKLNGEKLFTFGYYERSPITYTSPTQYNTNLKIRGLV